MKADTKYELGQTVKTVQGIGDISMIGITKTGTRYLVDLENHQGKCWNSEAELDKENAKPEGKGAAARAAALIILALLLWFTLGGISQAQPSFVTTTDGYVAAQSLTATNYNEVVFAGTPTKTIRLLSVDLQSETNAAFLHYYSGTVPYTVTGVINGTNLVVTSNAGIVTNQLAILQIGGTNWTATILYTNQLTNVVLAGGATLGFTPLTNSTLWHCGNRYLVGLGITKRQVAGECLFAAQVRAPMAVRIDPGVVSSNRLNAAVKYGSYDATVSTQ